MIRSLRLIALSIALPVAGSGCWMEVPNLQSTGGGYPPGMAASSGAEPDHEASTAAGGGSGTPAETPQAEMPEAEIPGAEPQGTETPVAETQAAGDRDSI